MLRRRSDAATGVANGIDDRVFERFLNEFPDVVIIIDLDGRVQWGNRAAEQLFARSLTSAVGMSGIELVHPEDLELVLLSMATIQSKEIGSPIEIRLQTATGWRLMELIGAPVSWFHEGSVILSLRDLTERRRYELSPGHEARFRTLVQSAPVITMLVSPCGLVESCSGALTRLLGQDVELVEGHPLTELVVANDRRDVSSALDRASEGAATTSPIIVAARLLRRGGNAAVPFELVVVNLVDDPTVGGYVITAHDISDQKKLEQQLFYQAFHDSLTGLGNRALFQDRLEIALARTERTKQQLALLFLDMDNLKGINDSLGHAAGDSALQALGQRLTGCIRRADTAVRLGGDEFGAIVESLTSPDGAVALAHRILDACREPLIVGATAVSIGVSIGIMFSRPGITVEDLLRGADRAMYAAKGQGRDRLALFEELSPATAT